MHNDETPTDAGWFERPRNINLLIAGYGIVCAATVLAQFLFEPHGEFALEKSFGFHAWFGFLSFIAIVYAGRFLRIFVGRKEDYYDHDR